VPQSKVWAVDEYGKACDRTNENQNLKRLKDNTVTYLKSKQLEHQPDWQSLFLPKIQILGSYKAEFTIFRGKV